MSQYLVSLGALYDAMPIPESPHRLTWLDARRDHVVTCLRAVAIPQLADLLGIPRNALTYWVTSRKVGPVVDGRAVKPTPNLERETVMQARRASQPPPSPAAPDAAPAPAGHESAPPAEPTPHDWPDLRAALEQALRTLDARLSRDAIESLRTELATDLERVFAERRDALNYLRDQLPQDFLRMVQDGALPFATSPMEIGPPSAVLYLQWSGSSERVVLTQALPPGRYRFLILVIPTPQGAPG